MERNAEQPKSGRAHWDKVPGKEGKGANEDVMIASEGIFRSTSRGHLVNQLKG